MLVCGDRNWTNSYVGFAILDWIHHSVSVTTVIEGEARGADRMARDWARSRSIYVVKFPALWDIHGRAAGPIRNQQMLDEGRPDFVVAFHDDLDASRGTAHMVRIATAAGLDVRCFTTTQSPPPTNEAFDVIPIKARPTRGAHHG